MDGRAISVIRPKEIQRQEQPNAIAKPKQLEVVRSAALGRAAGRIEQSCLDMPRQAGCCSIPLERPEHSLRNFDARHSLREQNADGECSP